MGKKKHKKRNEPDETVRVGRAKWPWLLPIIVLGQLVVSFGHKVFDKEVPLIGVAVAVLSSVACCYMARASILAYFEPGPTIKQKWKSLMVELAVCSLLIVMSVLNFRMIKIGYAEDEFLEFIVISLPAYKDGWLWWAAYDEPLTGNLAGLMCRLFSIRFETIKLTAMLLRTATGISLWLLARELYGRRIGLWVAVVTATGVMYVCSFNTLIKEMTAPLTFFLCLLFTFRGLRSGRWYDLLLGGSFAGLACYSYISRWALTGTLLCLPLFSLVCRDSRYSFRRVSSKLMFWVCGLLILSAPYVYNVSKYRAASFASTHAINQSSWHNGGLARIISDTWLDFLGITFRGDPWATNMFAGEPVLWWPWACVFWLGVVIMLTRLRELRTWAVFLLMGGTIIMAGANCLYTPNFKLSRSAMFLAAIPAAVGIDFLVSSAKRSVGWRWMSIPVALLVCGSAVRGYARLQDVSEDPASWWFRASNAMAPLERYVYSHAEMKFWGIGTTVTDVTANSTVRTVSTIKEVLETPGDGRDEVFLFRTGRREYMPRTQQLLSLWASVFPAGIVETHTERVGGNEWPTFVTFTVPSHARWHLPGVAPETEPVVRAAVLWQRAELLHGHGLPLEAWREAMGAAEIEEQYYAKADALFANKEGHDGRTKTLIAAGLWNEARDDIEHRALRTSISNYEQSVMDFLSRHGLRMEVFGTYTPGDHVLFAGRQYFPQLYLGYDVAPCNVPHLSVRLSGWIDIPQDGFYRIMIEPAADTPHRITVDETIVSEVSRTRCDNPSHPQQIHLTKGLHRLIAENCMPWRNLGVPPVTCGVPDVLGQNSGAMMHWGLKWQYNDTEPTWIPPQQLYVQESYATVSAE